MPEVLNAVSHSYIEIFLTTVGLPHARNPENHEATNPYQSGHRCNSGTSYIFCHYELMNYAHSSLMCEQ
jgi:hypothetical protein